MKNKFALKYIIVILLAFAIALNNFSQAFAADYSFKYTDKYLENKSLAKDIKSKKLYVIDEETGKKVKYETYKTKYEKRYSSYAKLAGPKFPTQPKIIKSTYNKLSDLEKKRLYGAFNKRTTQMYEDEVGFKLTDVESVQQHNLSKFKNLYETTGIKTNEKFFEDYIKNTFTYIERKTSAQIHNANNPNRKKIEKILKNPGKSGVKNGEISLAYSLFYNTKINFNMFDLEKYTYDVPYAWILGGCYKDMDVYNYRSNDIKVLLINGRLTNDSYEPYEEIDNATYIENRNKNEIISAAEDERDPILIGNDPSDLIYYNSDSFYCFFLMGASVYQAEFYLYNDKIVLTDIVIRSSGRITISTN